MLFPTITFAAFFMLAWPLSWLAARRPVARQLVLLAASSVFYAYWDWRYLGLLAGLVGLNHAGAHTIARLRHRPRWQRLAMGLAVGSHLAILGWFKYYGFFVTSVTSGLDRLGLEVHPPLVQVVLPLGISFVTFQAISHLVEVRREVIEPATLLETATWLTFFPTIASGPITRPSELVPQLREPAEPRVDAPRAYRLILRGLVKKLVVASFLADALADDVFAAPLQHSGPEVLLGVYAYAVQLYVDFSGYTDIAIGCALLLGLRLPENFDAPYAAVTVTEFWSRWHMTLTRWLRDFVFTPLVLHSRRTTAATVRNLLIVMLLTGLWHGAAWTFVGFGLVHGVAMAIERVVRERRRRAGRRPVPTGVWARVAGTVVTFHVVCLGWVLFRADSIDRAGEVLARIPTGGPSVSAVSGLLVVTIAAALALQQVPRGARLAVTARVERLGPVAATVVLAVGLLAVDVFGPAGVPPFLYFGF